MRVFIVDDSEPVRVRIVKLLERVGGVEVVGQAIDGNQAIELLSELHPDLVVLDLMMQRTSGYDVLCHVKRVMPWVKVAILTNYADAYWQDKCGEAGADYFLDKSTEFGVLLSTCARLTADAKRRGQ
jgi:DNA-binding NarL/FixJ family response regulator